MREIKFRAWDKRTRKMVETGFHVLGEVTAFDLLYQYGMEHGKRKNEPGILRMNSFILMQYTGLHDKNGTEIYEGDIVRGYVIQYYEQRSFPEYVDLKEYSVLEVLYKVEFCDGAFWFVPARKYAVCYGDIHESYLEKQLIGDSIDYNEYLDEMVEQEKLTQDDIENLRIIKVIGNIYENPELLVDKWK